MTPRDNFKKLLKNHVQRIEYVINQRKKKDDLFSKIRIGYFLTAFIAIIFSHNMIPDWLYLTSILFWIIGFIFIIDRHRSVYESQEKFEHLRDIKKEHIAKMELNWSGIKFSDLKRDTKHHSFADNLDILGKHSLYHLTNTSIYEESGQKLADWFLTDNPDKTEILKRQRQVKELIPLSGFRDKLRVIALFTSKNTSQRDWTTNQMLLWLRKSEITGYKVPLAILCTLSVINILFVILLVQSLLNPLFLVLSVVSYLLYYKLNEEKYAHLLDGAFQIEKILDRFKALLLHLEQFKPKKSGELESLLSTYHNEEVKPSRYIKRIQSLMSKAALRKNEILSFVVNVIVPWDLYYAKQVEELKSELEPKLSKWLNTFYKLEALNSLSNFAMLNPDYAFPDFDLKGQSIFKAEGLGHPLIPISQKVANDFEVQEGKDLFLITGSNMAGKSTFLRTIGVNLALAFSGGPVDAENFKTKLFRIFTSININDSLDDGLSHFYAEVKRLRYLLDELKKKDELPLFFFVDEIYRGTNNRERYTGSAAFLKEVAGKNGVGMISSHDLELADLEQEISELSNWHFTETIDDGKMSFSYKLKPGPCPSTNALKIMDMEGLPT